MSTVIEPLLTRDDPTEHPVSARGEPAWEIALLFPPQGSWSVDDYLSLETQTRRLIEFTDGCIEVLPMPTWWHQQILKVLFLRLLGHVQERGLGDVSFAPVPIRLNPRQYREPDLFFLSQERIARIDKYPEGVDLAVEVVSEGREARERDFETKRIDYAAAGISEYWIVDPEKREITVLTLVGTAYQTHGVFRGDEQATSVLLAGFAVRAAEVFAAGEPPA